jgi:hypothetical protein
MFIMLGVAIGGAVGALSRHGLDRARLAGSRIGRLA